MVTGLYGKKFNGYMGVATCFKLSDYSVVDVDISRLADKREAGWPRKQVSKHKLSNIFQGLYNKWYSCVASAMKSLFSLFKRNKNQRRIVDSWAMSKNQFNQLVTVTLQDKKTKKAFAVGNNPMPFAFYAPMVMTLHADLAARHVQRLASSSLFSTTASSLPYILAGDWNIKPGDSSYRLLTTGMMDKGKSCTFLLLDFIGKQSIKSISNIIMGVATFSSSSIHTIRTIYNNAMIK